MARVFWTDKAESSLLKKVRFIIEQNQSLQRGMDVLGRVELKAETYAMLPDSGTLRPDLGPGLRCFPVDSLLIVYRPVERGIAIILVAHGHQDIRTMVEELFGSEE